MAIDIIQTAVIIEELENFMHKKRPPIEIRSQVDLSYSIDNQSVILYEIRHVWNNPQESRNSNIARATYVKSKDQWDIYWMRSDLKWHSYKSKPYVSTIKEFLDLVDRDENHCFWG